MSDAPAIELKGISKSFGPVHANKDIDLKVMPGTIHGIIGENGAGKSTLMSILYGFYKADRGEMASETGTVSFVGGMDVPLIRKFACGYAQGAKAADADVEVIANMTGTTPAAWNDPVKGGELTRSQISQGSDVVFAAAGGTGVGVLQTAADEDILAIGVDSNQNGMFPGSILTSMVKRVDNAVYDAFTAGEELETGVQVKALEDEGVGVALDDNNADLVGEEMMAAVEEAKQGIIAGEIEVHDYTSDDSCPALTF